MLLTNQKVKKFINLFLSVAIIIGVLASCAADVENIAETTRNGTEAEANNLSVSDSSDYIFEYTITDDRGADFDAEVRIINMTNTAVNGWRLTFSGSFAISETQNAQLVSSNNSQHEVVNEFWTSTINPHSSAIFSLTASKNPETTPVLENFALSANENNDSDTPADVIALDPVTLTGYSESGYNVLLWNIEHVSESYSIYRSVNGGDVDSVATVSEQNYFIDQEVTAGTTYAYFVRNSRGDLLEESNTVEVVTSRDAPDGVSALEHSELLTSDRGSLRIGYRPGDNAAYVSQNLTLAGEGEQGSSVSWLSNFEQIINSRGRVTRPTGGFFPVVLTAVLQSGDFAQMMSQEVNVVPLNNVAVQDMTMERLEELNSGRVMPIIGFNNEGKIEMIEDSDGLREVPQSNISPFPVFSVEEARTLIDIYLPLFGLEDDIDIQLSLTTFMGRSNIIRFDQHYNGVAIRGTGMVVSANTETGHVTIVGTSYMPNLNMETTPRVTLEEAMQVVVSEKGVAICEQREHGLYIYNPNSDAELELAWEIYTTGKYISVCVSAITGEILWAESSSAWSGGV
jgi:hypothetical protein